LTIRGDRDQGIQHSDRLKKGLDELLPMTHRLYGEEERVYVEEQKHIQVLDHGTHRSRARISFQKEPARAPVHRPQRVAIFLYRRDDVL
jgi:hypothetical protein